MSASDESPVGGEEMMEGVEQGVGCAINKTKFGGCGLAIFSKEVPPPGCALKLDICRVRGRSVVPPFWLLWQGAGGVAGVLVNTIQAVYNFEVQLGRFYPAWRGQGDWRSRGNMGRGVRGIQSRRDGCF